MGPAPQAVCQAIRAKIQALSLGLYQSIQSVVRVMYNSMYPMGTERNRWRPIPRARSPDIRDRCHRPTGIEQPLPRFALVKAVHLLPRPPAPISACLKRQTGRDILRSSLYQRHKLAEPLLECNFVEYPESRTLVTSEPSPHFAVNIAPKYSC